MMKRRGGLTPASPGQEWCDACRQPLEPDGAVELTITRPPRHVPGLVTTRLYGHATCAAALADHAKTYLDRV